MDTTHGVKQDKVPATFVVGQSKKIVKDEKVKALFDLYGVEYSK
jgi:hypothetical protein